MALHETFERANDPPIGLLESTYSKPGANGRRGIMIIAHPSIAGNTQLATDLGGDNPNILWVRLEIDTTIYFIASVYLPDNRREKEADEVVRQLLQDISPMEPGAQIIIMGDWNYDPFIDKGSNKAAFLKMGSHPRMVLVRRNRPTEWTRPASKTHIDNLFISKTVLPKTSSKIFYLQIPPHPRTPSDHLLVGCRSTISGRRGRMRTRTLQFDNAPLRTCPEHAYSTVLDRLADRWIDWARDLSQELDTRAVPRRMETELLFAGLKFTVYSASFQTLPTKRRPERATNGGAMQTKFASGNSRTELWDVVARRLKRKDSKRGPDPDPQLLITKLREQGAKTPNSTCSRTKRWVRRVIEKLDNDPTPEERAEGPTFDQLVETYFQILLKEVKQLRWKTAGGLDNISAAQLKRSPPRFWRAVAIFAARCAWLKCFPRWFRLARAKFIPKPEAGKVRGLRLESLLTKLIEKCILHPFFPATHLTILSTPHQEIIAPEHFADRAKVSAEMTAGVLAIIIDAGKQAKTPLYILIADAKEAYDLVWRDGLWAKMANTHPNLEDVRRARAMYEHMDAQIVEEDFESEPVALGQGVPQGGPRSGKLYALFNSDLPEELRAAGAGVKIGEQDLTCAIYLDDSMIPSQTETVARKALITLEKYGDQWSQQWSIPKFKMLCLNVPNAPGQWPFKGHYFDTVQKVKYLGIHFDPLKGWSAHFAMKRAAALILKVEIRRAGLFGGKNAPADSLEVARSMLWSTLDYGRGVASSQGTRCKTVAKALDSFHLETLREILGTSDRSMCAGVRGETGEIPDMWRERKRQMLMARQMLTAPKGGLMRNLAIQANSSSPKLGVFRTVHDFLQQTEGPSIDHFRSKGDIKRWILMKATQEWRQRVQDSSRLARTYRHSNSLKVRGYLKGAYPGRQILTRMRLDDLDLGAASIRGLSEIKDRCMICGEDEETREHFVLRCPPLEPARQANKQILETARAQAQNEEEVLDFLILARPPGAEDDIKLATSIGKLFHDLWTLRTSAIGARPTLD